MHRLGDNGGELLHPVGLGSLIHSLLDMGRERERGNIHPPVKMCNMCICSAYLFGRYLGKVPRHFCENPYSRGYFLGNHVMLVRKHKNSPL